ncbi:MAG: YdeI/OmpD-associated family protein [Spirochaetales bacterium]|nr:YdeI/OmpD-associated family protein [Spirochaetales bacterium]
MKKTVLSQGVVHQVPEDLGDALLHDAAVYQSWESLTALARNEWICWVESAKKADTRLRRIERAAAELAEGKRRPCCWPGCPHRDR